MHIYMCVYMLFLIHHQKYNLNVSQNRFTQNLNIDLIIVQTNEAKNEILCS